MLVAPSVFFSNMKIDIKNAVSHFFSSHSLDMVYSEAVANAIDAGASKVSIDVEIESFSKPETLKIRISDNGCGFNSRNFEKFSRLLDVDAVDHKGVGRLVYLCYFDCIRFTSVYDNGVKREFLFDNHFEGLSEECDVSDGELNGTSILFEHFIGSKINSYSQLLPEKIKGYLLDSFLPMFFLKKRKNEEIRIEISLLTQECNKEKDFFSKKAVLSLDDVPDLACKNVILQEIDLYETFHVFYRIENDKSKPKKLTTKICVDGRTLPLKILTPDAIPNAYQVFIMVMSDALKGSTNASRQVLELSNGITEEQLLGALSPEVSQILSCEITCIDERNKKTYADVARKYPHLLGCYDRGNSVGLVNENQIIEAAQKEFFRRQKALLDRQDELSESDYYTALEFASRSLTEYIVYRGMIINKIKGLDKTQSEDSIHKIIVPRYRTYRAGREYDQYYSNNVWLLDDKFMAYDTVLSERTMKDVMDEVGEGIEHDEKKRPDIAIFLSADPVKSQGVDVVIVELKKYGISLAKQEEVESQLRQRARIILRAYPKKINRMWYYGIAEITSEFADALLERKYRPLFSKGLAFYNQIDVMETETRAMYPIDVCIMNCDAFINDAEARNDVFLEFLRKRMQSFASDDSK